MNFEITFDEAGEAVLQPEPLYSVEIEFNTEEEYDEFLDFLNSGRLGSAFKAWKGVE